MDSIAMAAPLHDIGKLKIRDEIVLKKGSLTDAEMEIMKTHTTCGAESLKEVYDNNQNEYLKMADEIKNKFPQINVYKINTDRRLDVIKSEITKIISNNISNIKF